MALITRVSRLFRADLHAVLDRVEEPDLLLRQAVREMEDAVAADEQRLRLMQHEHTQLQGRQQEAERSQRETEEALDVCFESNEDDLARTLVRRKLETQRLHHLISQKRKELESKLSQMNTRLEENRRRLESMRQKVELLAEDEPGEDTGQGWPLPEVTVRAEDVEIAFLREKKRRARP